MGKKANRVLLDVLDYGRDISTHDEMNDLPQSEWVNLIRYGERMGREVFDKEYNRRSINVLESLMEELDDMVEEGGEEKMKKYFQILNTLNEKTGFNTNKKIPGGYEIRVFGVDKDTLMVNYGLRKVNSWESFKTGSSPLRRILDMLVTPPIVSYID
jgi:hypothetical protein